MRAVSIAGGGTGIDGLFCLATRGDNGDKGSLGEGPRFNLCSIDNIALEEQNGLFFSS